MKKIAINIKNSNPEYERTYVGFRLKGQETNFFWATANFEPGLDLKVEIPGVSLENEQKIKKLKFDNALGAWLDDQMNVVIVLYYKDKKLFHGYKSASPEKDIGKKSLDIPDDEMVTTEVEQGLRVDNKIPNSYGDFYIINKNGDLESWNETKGKYFTYKKIISNDLSRHSKLTR